MKLTKKKKHQLKIMAVLALFLSVLVSSALFYFSKIDSTLFTLDGVPQVKVYYSNHKKIYAYEYPNNQVRY